MLALGCVPAARQTPSAWAMGTRQATRAPRLALSTPGRMVGGRPIVTDDGGVNAGPVATELASDDDGPVDLTHLASVERSLADIEQALARLEAGTWATCESCGGAIDLVALGERPATRRCAAHAAQPG